MSDPAAKTAVIVPPAVRVAVCAVLLALVVIGVLPANPSPQLAVGGAVLAAMAGVLMLWARPALLLVFAAPATAGVAVLGNGLSSNAGWFTVCLLQALCVLVGTRRDAVAYWIAAMALFAVEWIWLGADPGWGPWMAGTTLTLLAGLFIRRERRLVAQLRAAQDDLADRARSDERTRIARELHDVIAHTLTVSLLHVTSARLAVRHDPVDAERALAEAERLGRDSLTEVRSIVGMLRTDGAAGDRSPLPGTVDLPALVTGFRAAGLTVALDVDGDLTTVPATTGLAVYRIVQEALTNVAKHAAYAPVEVRAAVGSDAVTLVVDSTGAPGTGRGSGLLGMHERALSLGGACTAGPGGRGWVVRASLPMDAHSTAAAGAP